MAEFDPANRELCPDEMCIGVIGPDGRCKECDTVSPSATQHSRLRGMKLVPGGEGDDASHLAERELCPDELCVGVIGDDGTCGECGRERAEPTIRPVEVVDAGDALDARNDTDDDDPDIADRELCPDDLCVGVLGVDGRCKECGKSAT